MLKTPRLITLAGWDEYLASVSKKARYEYRLSIKNNAGRKYLPAQFDPSEVSTWMALWENQIVFGKHPRWGRYDINYFHNLWRRGWLRVFLVRGVALHMVQVCGDYSYAFPPLYDKRRHPEAARFCWFSLIRALTGEGGIAVLDLGGGSQKTWAELLADRDRSYKWLYIPKNEQPRNVRVQVCACGWRQLVRQHERCAGCNSAP